MRSVCIVQVVFFTFQLLLVAGYVQMLEEPAI